MAEYRIDELAHAAGTTSRNVRAYQERGLLESPKLHGRVGIYDDAHLARLKLIDSLLQRGFTTAHIADFIAGWENGKDLAEVLGLQDAVTAKWATSEAVRLPLDQVHAFLGSNDSDLIDQLVRVDLVRIEDDECVFTQPELMEGIVDLLEYGFDLRTLIDLHATLDKHVDDIARTMILAGKAHITAQNGEGWLPEADEIAKTTEMLNRMRELSVNSVELLLARALDRNLASALDDYLAAAVTKRHNEGQNRTA